MTSKELIIKEFKRVKKLGFVKSRRKNNTGIGKTFEDYIGVEENNIDKPDFEGFEIKAHRELSESYITLFTKSPSFPKGANAYLKDKYGTPYLENTELKRLHTSIFANRKNSNENKFSFKLLNDKDDEVVYIAIYSKKTGKLLSKKCGYTYSDIQKVISKKLKKLFYVSAETKRDTKGNEFFYFNHAEIYENPSLVNFLDLLDEGLIRCDIRIGSYKSGIKYGKAHDHGNGFRIKEKNLELLYSNKEVVK